MTEEMLQGITFENFHKIYTSGNKSEEKPYGIKLNPSYSTLLDVLMRAYDQAASGKGAQRHSSGEPFERQVMQDGARRFGVGGLLFQAFKKSEESQRLDRDAAVKELLGAINYLAGAVIYLEGKSD